MPMATHRNRRLIRFRKAGPQRGVRSSAVDPAAVDLIEDDIGGGLGDPQYRP